MDQQGTSRRDFLKLALATSGLGLPHQSVSAEPSPFKFSPEQNIIPAPDDPSLWPTFREQLAAWRAARRKELNYSDPLYLRPDFQWVRSNFACGFLMLCDETLYDHQTGRFRVSEFLTQEAERTGGFDSVVLWHAYPRIGLDDRNQFDFYRDMPGGLPGLRALSRELHNAGVKVFIDYNPWDTGTRREPKSDVDALCDLVKAIDADGIFLDTMDRGAAEFRTRLDAIKPGVALEGEIALPLDRIHDHHLSWAQWFPDSNVPGILRNKWFEPKHLQHQIRRWDFDHTAELHTAWMNGSGMMVWENVFGSWMGWNARDRSFLRAMLPIQRRYSRLFTEGNWTPLVPTLLPDVYASLWQTDELQLWTFVNRSASERNGRALSLTTDLPVYDLMTGVKAANAGIALPARGLGCLATGKPQGFGLDFNSFLRSQARLHEMRELATTYPRRETRLQPAPEIRRASKAPQGMVGISAASLEMTTEFRDRECGYYDSAPPDQHKFAASHDFRLYRFTRPVKLRAYAIDEFPVTNRDFATFLKESGYRPKRPKNFLRHWTDGSPSPEKLDHPVVYVDLADARAYAAWAGKRLPTEEEWQFAAQGAEKRKYPWGEQMLPGHCNSGETGGTTSVKVFPQGRSPFGVYDLCGNVWELTESERTDGRTRFCILKGGSFYTARGSGWYMDGGPRPSAFAAKFLLMWPGLDRCATIGFRCVVDLG